MSKENWVEKWEARRNAQIKKITGKEVETKKGKTVIKAAFQQGELRAFVTKDNKYIINYSYNKKQEKFLFSAEDNIAKAAAIVNECKMYNKVNFRGIEDRERRMKYTNSSAIDLTLKS